MTHSRAQKKVLEYVKLCPNASIKEVTDFVGKGGYVEVKLLIDAGDLTVNGPTGYHTVTVTEK